MASLEMRHFSHQFEATTMHIFTLQSFKEFAQDQAGATAIEYVMIAAAMGLALAASAPVLGTAVKGKFVSIGGYFSAM
jgi:Flp pilus assembly pilin Flp